MQVLSIHGFAQLKAIYILPPCQHPKTKLIQTQPLTDFARRPVVEKDRAALRPTPPRLRPARRSRNPARRSSRSWRRCAWPRQRQWPSWAPRRSTWRPPAGCGSRPTRWSFEAARETWVASGRPGAEAAAVGAARPTAGDAGGGRGASCSAR